MVISYACHWRNIHYVLKGGVQDEGGRGGCASTKEGKKKKSVVIL